MRSSSERRTIVKLGGSIVTEKGAPTLTVRDEQVRRLGRELTSAVRPPGVLVHGAGSFGHQIVRRTGLDAGLSDDASLLVLGETQRLQYELDSRISQILLAEGLPVMPCQASASAIMSAGKLKSMDVGALRLMIDAGMVPLLYGVPALDDERGCSILSGDQIAPYVARELGFDRIIHATDVDGVYDRDPTEDDSAKRFDRVDRSNWDEVRSTMSGSRAVDVTGGMAGKVESLLELARAGVITRIIDARRPGRLAAALAGEPVGTLVTWATMEEERES